MERNAEDRHSLGNGFMKARDGFAHDGQIDTDWMREAACRGMNPDLFFPEHGGPQSDIDNAKAVCAECPVREPCLEYAIRTHETAGIWGGTTNKDRRLIWRQRHRERRQAQQERMLQGE